MKAPLLTVAAIIAFTGALVSCGDSEEMAPLPTATPGGQTGLTASPATTPTPSIPADLPAAAEGYGWFVSDAYSPVAYAVQIPAGWEQKRGGGRTDFVPVGTADNFPYSDIPRLTFLASRIGGLWPHPVQAVVGRQGGGGCQGDIQDGIAEPSSKQIVNGLEWEYFSFTCGESNANFPPGVKYAGRAWEAHLGDYIVSTVLIESPDLQFPSEHLQQALDTFGLR